MELSGISEDATVAERARENDSSRPEPVGGALADRLVLAAVVLVAGLMTAIVYQQFLASSAYRWNGIDNDRNAHYLLALEMSIDIRRGDFVGLYKDFDRARSWPPFHGILATAVLLVGGPDYRLAVLPSLAGWFGSVILVFLIARRAVPKGGNVAGLVAALFMIASPAHRAFATDIMLESLGAFLSLLCIYCYMRGLQESSTASFRWLGMSLMALYLEKYNFWLLIVVPLVLTELLYRWPTYGSFARTTWLQIPWRRWAAAQVRSPLSLTIVALISLIVWVFATGGKIVTLWGQRIDITDYHNLAHAAFILSLIQMVRWYRRGGSEWIATIDPRLRAVLAWHVVPLAIWWLVPKRLGYFLYYVTKRHSSAPYQGIWWGVVYYWDMFWQNYHVALPAAIAVTCLAIVGVLSARRLRPGALLLILCLFVAAAATIPHTQRMSRCLHSWIAVSWILAGIGAAWLSQIPLPRLLSATRPVLVALGLLGLGAWQLPQALSPGHSEEWGHRHEDRTTLVLPEFYLPYLEDSQHPAFFATLPIRNLAQWTYLERFPERPPLDVFFRKFGESAEENRVRFAEWLQKTSADTVVLVDIPPGATEYFEGYRHYAQVSELFASQSVFKPWKTKSFEKERWQVTLWKRDVETSVRQASIDGGPRK